MQEYVRGWEMVVDRMDRTRVPRGTGCPKVEFVGA